MDVTAVREKVQHFLTKQSRVEIDKDGDFSVQHGSARVFVRVVDWGDGETIISIWTLVVIGATPSAELSDYIAYGTDDYIFGHLGLAKMDDGTANILFSHRLLGDTLDEDELMHAVAGVASTTNSIDDELVARFGGRTFHQE